MLYTPGSGALVHATRASTKDAFAVQRQLEATAFENLKSTCVSPDACTLYVVGTSTIDAKKALLRFSRDPT